MKWEIIAGVHVADGRGGFSYRAGKWSDWPYVKFACAITHEKLPTQKITRNTLEKVQQICEDHNAVIENIEDESR